MAIAFQAVSYTHLDVYKRQPFRSAYRRYRSTTIDSCHDAARFVATPRRSHQIHRFFAGYAKCDKRINRRVALETHDRREEAVLAGFFT